MIIIHLFLKKTIQNKQNLLLLPLIFFIIMFFYFFTSTQQNNTNVFYEKYLYNDSISYDDIIEEANHEDIEEQWIFENDQILKEKWQSYQTKKQTIFLKHEANNLFLSESLIKEYPSLDVAKYNKGKQEINNYLIKNQLPLKSIKNNTDGSIFLMNILEFLNTPLFFLIFFLLTTKNPLKKYEDKRISLLLTLPVSRYRIVFYDYILYLKKIFIILIEIIFLSLIFGGQSSWRYPVLITLLGEAQILPIYLYLIMLTILYFIIGTFIYLCIYFFTIILKKSTLSIILVSMACMTAPLISQNSVRNIHGLNPFLYTNTEKIVKNKFEKGDLKYILPNDNDSYQNVSAADTMIGGNIVENPYYYANNSFASSIKAIDVSLQPIVLLLYSFILLLLISYCLDRYKI